LNLSRVRTGIVALKDVRELMDDLIREIRRFTEERDWDQFHSPKNLAMALTTEAAEIAEIFQWLTEERSKVLDGEMRARLEEEIGDVMIYLAHLADAFGLDPLDAARKKLLLNAEKYPAEAVRGSARKYTEYG
jgi:NTP pyrophosphatase (non-canonical NTP hydrolase)